MPHYFNRRRSYSVKWCTQMQPEFLKMVAMLCGRILTYPRCFHEKALKVWLLSYLMRASDSRCNVLSTFNNFFEERTLGIGTILLDIAGTQYSVHTCFFLFFFFFPGFSNRLSTYSEVKGRKTNILRILLLSDTATLRYEDWFKYEWIAANARVKSVRIAGEKSWWVHSPQNWFVQYYLMSDFISSLITHLYFDLGKKNIDCNFFFYSSPWSSFS